MGTGGCSCLYPSVAEYGPLMLLPTAKRIWDQVTLLYSGMANISRICSTYSEWVRFRRGDLPLAAHYSHFVGLCQQLDVYMPLTTDLTEAARQRDQIRVVQYLESLGPEYMHLRQQIIGSGAIPSLTEVYSCVQQCSPGDSVIFVPIDGSALATYNGSARRPRSGASSGRGRTDRGGGRSSGGRGRSFCTHCQREGYYIDHCYTLHPELRQVCSAHMGATTASDSAPSASVSAPADSACTLSRADYEEFQRLRLSSRPPSAGFAQPDLSASLPSSPIFVQPAFADSTSSATLEKPAPPKIKHQYQRRKVTDKSRLPPLAQSSSEPMIPLSRSHVSSLPPSSVVSDSPIASRTRFRSIAHPISNFVSYDKLTSTFQSFVYSLSSMSLSQSVAEAPMHLEMGALHSNDTWDLVSLPPGACPVGCRWVFSIKYLPDSTVERLKARLVAKGYTQTFGVDYTETFSPVAKIPSVRALLSLAVNHGWPLHQLDVKNAFLHGDLTEEVYMEQPPGFVAQGETSSYVCRLRKSIYGLKQSLRAWFGRFSEAVMRFGLKQCAIDHSVFSYHSSAGCILLIVYVDDIIITWSNSHGIQRLKTFLQKEFSTKDLGQLRYFLGTEVARSSRGLFLSQGKYVLDLLNETGNLGVKPASAPMDPNVKLVPEGELLEDPGRYRRLVGKLIYLTVTRSDISYAVGVFSQYMSSPRTSHWAAVIQILKYLKGAPGKGLMFKRHGHMKVEGFSDTDWAGSPTDRRSTTGYCTFVGGILVSWKSKK
ncbi:uncharacterized protein LOC143855510 [Tasmannia lanceolata]|uniref:uncharacterized protein LOC143855510 n=1 Tax=Tasmannia lanceolata TaxID=3420 RepID=UPI0040629335